MQMKDMALRSTCWVSVVFFVELISILLCYPPSLLAANGAGSQVFSLEVRGEPLGEVLKKISNDTDYKITVDPGWAGLPVSVSFKSLPIEQGLRRILLNMNHSIIFNEADHCIFIVIKSFLNGEEFQAGGRVKMVDEGPSGAVRSSAAYYKNFINPGDIQVIPPTETGEPGMTLKEHKEIEAHWVEISPDDIEVIPPAEHVEKGVTLKEIRAQQNLKKTAGFKDKELVPPSSFGQNQHP